MGTAPRHSKAPIARGAVAPLSAAHLLEAELVRDGVDAEPAEPHAEPVEQHGRALAAEGRLLGSGVQRRDALAERLAAQVRGERQRLGACRAPGGASA